MRRAGPSDREAALLASFGSFEAPDARPAAAPREHREDRGRGNFGRSGSRDPPGRRRGAAGFPRADALRVGVVRVGNLRVGMLRVGTYSDSFSAGGEFSAGIEPLPGESLSKWKTHHTCRRNRRRITRRCRSSAVCVVVAADAAGAGSGFGGFSAASEIDETHVFSEGRNPRRNPRVTCGDGWRRESGETHMFRAAPLDSVVERHESASERTETGEPELHADDLHTHELHTHEGLTDEEVTALAEHIADAKDDLAARDAQERGFAAADAAARPGAHGVDAVDEEQEDSELEEEEAAAEEEGMIAHSDMEMPENWRTSKPLKCMPTAIRLTTRMSTRQVTRGGQRGTRGRSCWC